jgi:hypothetical protein
VSFFFFFFLAELLVGVMQLSLTRRVGHRRRAEEQQAKENRVKRAVPKRVWMGQQQQQQPKLC